MKIKNLKYVFLTITIAIASVSCESYFDEDNSDPNKPFAAPVSATLPNVQLTLVDNEGGLFSHMNNMFIQQIEGVERQWESFNKYDIQPVRYNFYWQQIYENVLVELATIKAEAMEGGLNHYLGIAYVCEAYALMMASDVWGDMPYTEAGLGQEGNVNPAYDDQATVIYPAIRSLLEDAINLFNGSGGPIAPGNDDVLYGGDTDKWTMAANGILARYYLHLGDNANALAHAKMSFGSRADNLGYDYPGAGNDAPYFGFNDVREGDLEFHPTMRGIMQGLNDDDRLGIMDNTFNASHPYFTADQRQNLLTYREMQFIIAETSTDDMEQHTAYINGIRASFTELGLGSAEADAYIAQAMIDPGAGNLTMDHIMTQKYIAMFSEPEAHADWRRTGIPSLTPVAGSAVPRRWYYPENEYLFNSSTPARNDNLLFERVDWDTN